jgi:prolipoprotein diacylglyceryltransferase
MSPQRIYEAAQIAGALGFFIGMLAGLRRSLGWKRSLVLSLAPLVLAMPGAEFVARLAGMRDSSAYYGALLTQLVVTSVLVFLMKIKPVERRRIHRVFGVTSGLVYAILRVGCFYRGCCWGTFCRMPWAISYRSSDVVTPMLFVPLHPVQIYSMIHGLVIAGGVFYLSKRFPKKEPLGFFFLILGLGRLVTDIFRADIVYHHLSWLGFSPNTLLSVLVMSSGLYLLKGRSKT